MKTVLFVCALPIELNIIKSEIKNINLRGLKVKFLLSWVWNYNTIFSLKNYIDTNSKPDFIVNIWVCWVSSLKEDLDFFQVYRVKNSSNLKEFLIPIYFNILDLKSILSSDTVITNNKYLIWENYVDMESYGICFVTDKDSIPLIIIKKPFDVISEASKNVNKKDLWESLRNLDYNLLLEKISSFLNNSKGKNSTDLWFYKEYFRFTFSQNEIFKKNYNKFIAFWKDFSLFFKKNKNLPKKEFLKKMLEE